MILHLPWWIMLWSSNFCTSLMAVSLSEASLWSISQSISSLATKQFGYVLRWCRRSLMTFSSCSRSLGVKSPCKYHLQRSVTARLGWEQSSGTHALLTGWALQVLGRKVTHPVPLCHNQGTHSNICYNFKPHNWKNLFSLQWKSFLNFLKEQCSILSPLKYFPQVN